ncbi:MAG TPA: hypothetical protein PK793_02025, partial [Syntrophales bacterium]|nr:hypothetical protein [Syntrophales bacterium]HPV52817.1 hypothetical protein [Syntrophales bacterium]
IGWRNQSESGGGLRRNTQLLLDEILRHPTFPIKKYDDYASRLYGTITSALRSKKAVLCLAKFSEDIFPDEE